jgi:spore coat polysaccharide biosynthesis protein SpsF (cytidylyltransferase family)
VDTPEDLELVRKICAHFPGRNDFSWLDVLHLVEQNPELSQLNAGIKHKSIQDVDDRAKKIQS